ncbi:kinase that interacts with cdc31p [Sorochytrium milnesiophthora]
MSSAKHFVKQERIGRGSFGEVFKGVNTQTGNPVAIKILDLETSGDDINDIQREINLLRRCESDNITKYHGSFIVGTKLWIIMDYAKGGSLRDVMRSGPIDEKYICIMVREVLQALCYLHKNGIIHRDIKAANILLTEDGQVQLCDFGVAGQISFNSLKRHSFVGTPYWMAPEVFRRTEYDAKADIWSLGITIYEIATGGPPHMKQEPGKALFLAHTSQNLKLGSGFSAAIQEFIGFCLREKPEERLGAEELLKTKFIRNAPAGTVLLRELVVRHEEWQARLEAEEASLFGDSDEEMEDDDTSKPSKSDNWTFDTVRSTATGKSGTLRSLFSRASTAMDAKPPPTVTEEGAASVDGSSGGATPQSSASISASSSAQQLDTSQSSLSRVRNMGTLRGGRGRRHHRNQSSVLTRDEYEGQSSSDSPDPPPLSESMRKSIRQKQKAVTPPSKLKPFPSLQRLRISSPHIPRSFSDSQTVYNPLLRMFEPPPQEGGPPTSPISATLQTSPSMPFIIDTTVLTPAVSPSATPVVSSRRLTATSAYSNASSSGYTPAGSGHGLPHSGSRRFSFFSKSRAMDSRLYKPIQTISNAFSFRKDQRPDPDLVFEDDFPPARPRASTAPEIRHPERGGIRRLSFLLNFAGGANGRTGGGVRKNSASSREKEREHERDKEGKDKEKERGDGGGVLARVRSTSVSAMFPTLRSSDKRDKDRADKSPIPEEDSTAAASTAGNTAAAPALSSKPPTPPGVYRTASAASSPSQTPVLVNTTADPVPPVPISTLAYHFDAQEGHQYAVSLDRHASKTFGVTPAERDAWSSRSSHVDINKQQQVPPPPLRGERVSGPGLMCPSLVSDPNLIPDVDLTPEDEALLNSQLNMAVQDCVQWLDVVGGMLSRLATSSSSA